MIHRFEDLLLPERRPCPPNPDGISVTRTKPSASYTPWLALPAPDELRRSLHEGVALTIERYAQGAAGVRATRSNAYDLSRAGWQAVCPLRRDAVVLDFGCGLGAVSRSLARNCRGVVGLDACYERLMIHGAINREEEIDNVALVFGDHETLGALRPACVDGVVLNGVLEWVPEYMPGHPRDAQVAFLVACRRVLKDDGWLYIGIENRWGFRYFLGQRDEHTGLIGSSLLPRVAADLYSQALRGRPYRTLTHGPGALARLLEEAGFSHVQQYAPLPDYRHFGVLAPIDGDPRTSGAARHLGISKSWKRRVVEAKPVFQRLVPSLGYVASPQPLSGPRWLADMRQPLSHVYLKHDQASIWPRDPVRTVREVALSTDAAARIERMASFSTALRDHADCPSSLKTFEVHRRDGYVWVDRAFVAGKTLDSLPADQRASQMSGVFAALRKVHQLGERVPGDPLSLCELVAAWAPNGARDISPDLRQRMDALARHLDSGKGRRLLMHGDCSAKNIVLAGRGAELIDWEWSRLVGFPGYDVLKLAWHDLEDPFALTPEREELRRYCEDPVARAYHAEVHDDSIWLSSVMTYWLIRLARSVSRFRHGGMPTGWAGKHVAPVVAAMEGILESKVA